MCPTVLICSSQKLSREAGLDDTDRATTRDRIWNRNGSDSGLVQGLPRIAAQSSGVVSDRD